MVLIFLTKTRGGGKRRIGGVALFNNGNEAMNWLLVESVGKD